MLCGTGSEDSAVNLRKVRFAVDSPLEEGGLELPVPPRDTRPITGASHRSSVILAARSGVGVSGPGSSNPPSSSDESYKPDRTSRIRLYASTAVLTIPSAIVARMASTIAEELTDFPRVPALNKGGKSPEVT